MYKRQQFAYGRDERPNDNCRVGEISEALEEGPGDLREAVIRLVTSPGFRFIKEPDQEGGEL